MIIDACAFTGRWPFRKLGRPELVHLLEDHARNGITGGVVSSLESIFYNDPMEGDEELAAKLPARYKLALTHNPLLPYAIREIGKNELSAAAVRLFPSYHGYNPRDEIVQDFCRAAAAAKLIVFIVLRMDDVRTEYLFHQTVPPVADVLALARAVPECRFVLSGALIAELCREAEAIRRCANLCVDTPFMGTPAFPFDAIHAALPMDRILYASYYPLLCLESGVLALERSSLDAAAKDALRCNNARTLFGF